MRCLYCGKELALFKRLTGGEFCSDAHRLRYQEEYTQLALNRLLQANSSPEKESAPLAEIKSAEPESPALKRRERLGREETPAPLPALSTPLAPASGSIAKPFGSEENGVGPAVHLAAFRPEERPKQIAVLDPEPTPAAAPAFVEKTEEPAPADLSNFLVEVPVAVVVEAAAIPKPAANLAPAPAPALPRLQEFPWEAGADRLDPAGRIALNLFTLTDFQTPPRERGLELREFVRGVPQVEIRIRPASGTGLEPAREALPVPFVAHPPEDSSGLYFWPSSKEDLPAFGRDAEILLGDLARLDFPVTGWEEAQESGVSVQPPSPADEPPHIIARLEPIRVEPIQPDPPSSESSGGVLEKLQPLRFEPVHIDPVFMERIAGSAEFNAQMLAANTPAAVEPEAPAPAPPTITKPVPVTLHGLAPARGKPVQVFTSAVSRSGDIQVPRETGLPLRPTMVLGPAPKVSNAPANVPASVLAKIPQGNDEKAATARPVKSIPVPEKRDPRSIEIKPRKSEVRILPVQAKEALPRQKEPAARPPEPLKPEPASRAEAVKSPPGPTPKEMAPKGMALKETPAEKPKAAPVPAEIKPVAPVSSEIKPAAPVSARSNRPRPFPPRSNRPRPFPPGSNQPRPLPAGSNQPRPFPPR